MLSKNRGVTLIELLIALVISSILIASVYRTFIGQQKTYNVQEQVVDMQQNVRVAINKMMREIRMAGFGNVTNVLAGGVNGPTKAITTYPSSTDKIDNNNSITIVGGFKQIKDASGNPILISSASGTTVTLDHATDEFDGAAHRYISIGGLESNTVHSRARAVLTLDKTLKVAYPAGTPVFKVQAITYTLGLSDGKPVLQRDENTGGHGQPLADNIESLQFEYYDGASPPNPLVLPIADPGIIRMIRVTLTAKTNTADPELLKTGDGYRRRTIASNIQVRNMGISP